FDVAITSDAALSLVKTLTNSTVTAGDGDHTFTLVVKNTGSFSTAHHVVVTDLVDGRLIVASESSTGTGDCTASASQSVSCSFAALAAGVSQTITVHYSVDASTLAGTATNTGNAKSDDVASVDSNT